MHGGAINGFDGWQPTVTSSNTGCVWQQSHGFVLFPLHNRSVKKALWVLWHVIGLALSMGVISSPNCA